MQLMKLKTSSIFKTIKCVNDLILIQCVFICLHVTKLIRYNKCHSSIIATIRLISVFISEALKTFFDF